MRLTTSNGLAPSSRAASINGLGIEARPEARVMATSGAWCSPITRMMPNSPSIGFGVPGAGARPMSLSRGDAGPASVLNARAEICGAIISDMTMMNASAVRARSVVTDRISANTTPTSSASPPEPKATTSVLRVARHTSGVSRTCQKAPRPPSKAAAIRRPTGIREKTRMKTASASARPLPSRCRQPMDGPRRERRAPSRD
jgi:hypothetical protein